MRCRRCGGGYIRSSSPSSAGMFSAPPPPLRAHCARLGAPPLHLGALWPALQQPARPQPSPAGPAARPSPAGAPSMHCGPPTGKSALEEGPCFVRYSGLPKADRVFRPAFRYALQDQRVHRPVSAAQCLPLTRTSAGGLAFRGRPASARSRARHSRQPAGPAWPHSPAPAPRLLALGRPHPGPSRRPPLAPEGAQWSVLID